jgi:FKBP-type peptidyl-prolyl cis-trans isomerase FkpA/FKBP-type peptidyl-prolyl cis-trans isomerase FklB
MKTAFLIMALLSGWAVHEAFAVTPAPPSTPTAEIKTEADKTLYGLGVALSQNIAIFNLTPGELALVKAGLDDGVLNRKKQVDIEQLRPKIEEMARTRGQAAATIEKEKAAAFLKKASSEAGATQTASGLIFSEMKAGTGAAPKPTDTVKVHYHGTLIDGTIFDSSVSRGEPATFPLNSVIPCWTEGLQKIKVGGKGKLICPSSIAYGDRGASPKIKPGATIPFDVELLEIVKKQ